MSTRTQQQIPGTEMPSIPEIEEPAEEYRAFRDERMAVQLKEQEAQKRLVAAMQSRNMHEYRYEGADGQARKVRLDDVVKAKVIKVKAKVIKVKDDGGGSGGDDN